MNMGVWASFAPTERFSSDRATHFNDGHTYRNCKSVNWLKLPGRYLSEVLDMFLRSKRLVVSLPSPVDDCNDTVKT